MKNYYCAVAGTECAQLAPQSGVQASAARRSAFSRFALSHIAAAALLLSGSGAWAVGLGRLSVQSALGETLKAEIDITSLSPEEAASLKVRIAPPESYRATGVEYNSVLTSTQVQVLKKDGRSFLRVSSDRAVQEPFVDVILELTWANGRLVREYTLLFDPPTATRTNGAAAAAPAAPVVTAAPAISPAPAAQTEPVPAPAATAAVPIPPSPSPSPVARAPRETAAPVAAPAPAPRTAVAAPAPAASAASEYKVKPGDNLSRIAGRTQPEGISLDQMLVGLFRNNPDAFLDGNMNRLRSGVVLQVPGSETLGALPTAEARQVIRAQSADFSAYRLRLSSAAPTLQTDQSQRQAKGKVEAAVEDRKPAPAPTPDKLTLSKAASANADAKLAAASKEAEKKDAAARMAELTRNVEELKKISSAAKPAAAASVAAALPAPAAAPVAPTPAQTPAPAPVAAALPALPLESAASAPGLPSTVASAPAPKPPVATSAASAASAALAPALPEKAEPGLVDQLLENPLTLPLGAALLAALGGLAWYRKRGAKAAGKADTGFHESRLQPDSFFGATGGQRVDTRDATGAASSMNYSLSQLDAIGDVDPVAEADVYLAYGRDLQAEEILKEALRATPERMAIRLKLLEVYAKRRDTKGFEQLAVQLYAETSGAGQDWARAQELGRQIDPENPLYQPGGVPSQQSDGREVHPEPMDASTMPHTVGHLATEPVGRSAQAEAGPMSGFDLDLDLDLGAPAAAPPSPIAMEATQAMTTTIEQAPFAMDFDLSEPPAAPAAPAVAAPAAGNELEFDLDDFGSLDDEPLNRPAPAEDGNALDFDLGSIDLSLPELPNVPVVEEPLPVAESVALDGDFGAEFDELMKAGEVAVPAADPLADAFDLMDDGGDPLMRQLELADEFRQIGDTEGAREVLQELISKSSGPLRDKAQAMLNDLR